MQQEDINLEVDRENLLIFVWKNRKKLIIISSIAAVATAIIAFLMTPLFLSTAIVFPAATSSVSFSEQRNAKASSMDFGEEEQAEQLVQILQSSQIRNRVIEKFELMKHYEIDADDANKNYKLMKAYNNHISFTRTRFGSIQIDVLDRVPEKAADIANHIVDLIDSVKNNMVMERTVPAFHINQRKKEMLEADLQHTLELLDSLAGLGVVSSEGRANLFQAYIDSKNQADKDYLKEKLDVNLKNGAKFDALETLREEKITKMEKFLDSYDQAESDAYTNFTHKFVVEKAVVADKKEKPKRLILIILVTMGTFLFSVFTLLILDRLKELKKIA
jgi:LPS O-antigen subunit length determinant protein (WzzB/FepE family)